MLKSSVIVIVTCLLAACTTSPQAMPSKAPEDAVKKKVCIAVSVPVTPAPQSEAATVEDWLEFIGRIKTLDALELAGERDRIVMEHRERPSDGSRLALGYLLSQPQPLVRDIEKSRMLLDAVVSSSAYAPVRDLVVRELAKIDEITDLQAQVTRLQSQLDALKVIETDLTENQKELEEVPQ